MNHHDLEKYNSLHYQDDQSVDGEIDTLYRLTGKCPKLNVDSKNAWNKIARQIQKDEDFRISRFNWYSFAATLVVFVGLGYLVATFFYKNNSQKVSALTEKKSYVLPDGSSVTLDVGSSLYHEKTFESLRKVTLAGNAFFDVEKSSKPFIIEVPSGEISVLGTSFAVMHEKDLLRVLVKSGKVKLAAGKEEIKIEAGKEGIFNEQKRILSLNHSPDFNDLFWMTGTFEFDATKLSNVAEKIEAQYNVEIEFADPTLANCTITGTFTNPSIVELLEEIETILGIEVNKKENKFILSGKGC